MLAIHVVIFLICCAVVSLPEHDLREVAWDAHELVVEGDLDPVSLWIGVAFDVGVGTELPILIVLPLSLLRPRVLIAKIIKQTSLLLFAQIH